jgi:hypothetical protein
VDWPASFKERNIPVSAELLKEIADYQAENRKIDDENEKILAELREWNRKPEAR